MKKISLLLLLLPLKIFSQTDSIPKNAEGKYEYTAVVKVDSASADKLYSNAKLFIVDAFKSGKDVTQLNDDVAKTVVVKGTHKIILAGFFDASVIKYLWYQLFIQCKDGKYKYTINNFQLQEIGKGFEHTFDVTGFDKKSSHFITKKEYEKLNAQISEFVPMLVADLKKHMTADPQDF